MADNRAIKTTIKNTEKRVRGLLTEPKTTVGHKCEMARLLKTQAIERGEWPLLSAEIRMNLTLYSNLDRINIKSS
jgi:hypothetical protein